MAAQPGSSLTIDQFSRPGISPIGIKNFKSRSGGIAKVPPAASHPHKIFYFRAGLEKNSLNEK